MRRRHCVALLIGKQQRQAVSHHDGACKASLVCHASICLGALCCVFRQRDNPVAMDLGQIYCVGANCVIKNAPVALNMLRKITHMLSKIETVIGR
jgi:hypothetical protein